jgi:hypothetical protein
MKTALPREDVVPWASEHLIPWIFSMIAISASKRASAVTVYSTMNDLINRHWNKGEICLESVNKWHSHIC